MSANGKRYTKFIFISNSWTISNVATNTWTVVVFSYALVSLWKSEKKSWIVVVLGKLKPSYLNDMTSKGKPV